MKDRDLISVMKLQKKLIINKISCAGKTS